MWKDAMWLGVPRAEIEEKQIFHGDMNGRFAYYRLTLNLEEPGELTVDISANSRYRLWVNGQPVLSGPCRSNQMRQFYETVELGPFLKTGKNVLAVQVLLCDSMYVKGGPEEKRAPLVSVETLPAGHRLAVEGIVKNAAGEEIASATTGKADWRVWLDNTFFLTKEHPVNDNMGALTEHIDFSCTLKDWKKLSFEDTAWRRAEVLEPVAAGFEGKFGILKTFIMEERPIPLAFEVPAVLEKELGEPVMGSADSVMVKPGEKCVLLFDGGALFNAYFRYRIQGGAGAGIKFTYFEKFTRGEDEVKRDDYRNGSIGENGQTDTIVPGGGELVYEPFWYRTMRFLQVEIQAGEEAVRFYRPQLLKTGYPLNAASVIRSKAVWVEPLYNMCVRTLQGCMMETYMDCPFWEQMQYPMDTRLQALFTYVCSVDTRLARKALQDFHDSILPMGLVQGRTPSTPRQIISTFSLHYIFMLLEYYKRTGDRMLLKKYRADVDRILEYYDGHIGSRGLVEDLGYWDFVDWQEDWNTQCGRPAAVEHGPSTIINLMYALALVCGAEIYELTGRPGVAQEYRNRQQAVTERVQALCWDEERGLYREGPDFEQFTQHAQSWAVLNGMLEKEAAGEVMRRTFTEEDVLRCYFSTCYELFRACEKAGCYELTEDQMSWWIHLLDEHCTTCPETPHNSRSECHAWSALPMYELLAVMAGIRRESGDPARLYVCPHLDYVPNLEGRMITELGPVEFDYAPLEEETEGEDFYGRNGKEAPQTLSGACKKGKMRYRITLPEGMSGSFYLEGYSRELKSGVNVIEM